MADDNKISFLNNHPKFKSATLEEDEARIPTSEIFDCVPENPQVPKAVCKQCRHSRKKKVGFWQAKRWVCTVSMRPQVYDPVTGDLVYLSIGMPLSKKTGMYEDCANINFHGDCPKFQIAFKS